MAEQAAHRPIGFVSRRETSFDDTLLTRREIRPGYRRVDIKKWEGSSYSADGLRHIIRCLEEEVAWIEDADG